MAETFMGLKGRSCGMEVGDWRMENRGWGLENRGWGLENGGWGLGNGDWELVNGKIQNAIMESKILSYRDLEVWKNGVKPAKDIYRVTELSPSVTQIFIYAK